MEIINIIITILLITLCTLEIIKEVKKKTDQTHDLKELANLICTDPVIGKYVNTIINEISNDVENFNTIEEYIVYGKMTLNAKLQNYLINDLKLPPVITSAVTLSNIEEVVVYILNIYDVSTKLQNIFDSFIESISIEDEQAEIDAETIVDATEVIEETGIVGEEVANDLVEATADLVGIDAVDKCIIVTDKLVNETASEDDVNSFVDAVDTLIDITKNVEE